MNMNGTGMCELLLGFMAAGLVAVHLSLGIIKHFPCISRWRGRDSNPRPRDYESGGGL